MQFGEASIIVSKKARYFTWGNDITSAERIWFACHGYGQQAKYFVRKFESLDPARNFVVAPEGLHRFYLEGFSGRVGANWMTKEARLDDIDDNVHYFDSLHEALELNKLIAGQKLIHFGFSQGVATIARYIAFGKYKANTAVFWAGTFPPDLDALQCRTAFAGLPVHTALGNTDPFVGIDHMKNNAQHLDAMGIAPIHLDFEGGHDIVPDALLRMENSLP